MRLSVVVVVLTLLGATSAWGQIADEEARREALKHYRAGQELLNAESWEKAANEFTRAIKLDNLLTLAHYGLGQANMGMKNYRAAIRAFTGCREACRALHSLAGTNRMAVERQQNDEIRELRDSLSTLNSPRVQMDASIRLQTQNRIEQRIRDLEKARGTGITAGGEFQPPSEVSLALGSAYFRAGDLADAEREYGEAVRVNPKMGEAHNNLAVIYMMSGRLTEAENEVKLAEKNGFRVNPALKDDLKKRKAGVS